MAEGVESSVQVAPAGGGPNVRNVQLYYWNATLGAFAKVQQQFVTQADKDGFVVDLAQQELLTLTRAMVMELQDIRRALNTLSGLALQGADALGVAPQKA